jgi:hypothetical protein
LKSRLILVEGIPGSGKSTTAGFIAGWLQSRQIQTHLYIEGQPGHPADPDGLAFFSETQYRSLLAEQAEFRELLEANAKHELGGTILDYRSMDKQEQLPDPLFEALSDRDIYATFPPEQFKQIALARWQAFGRRAAGEEGVYVFECCFLQNPYTVLLGQHNCAPEDVNGHIQAVARAIEPLSPRLVYLDVGNVRKVLQNAVETRPQAWINFVTDYITSQGYGQAHGLEGLDGVIQFYEMMKQRMEKTIEALKWPTLHVNVSQGDWEGTQMQIEDFLVSTK